MGLFGTIQQSAGALQAAQIGLQVVGNNIANANTEGYVRQRLEQVPAQAIRQGGLLAGQGVRPSGIVHVIDKALFERMIQAKTAASGSSTLDAAYAQLEELTAELDNNGLNKQLSDFNNALHELTTQPGDASLREFVILQGETLASSIQTLRQKATDRQSTWNGGLQDVAGSINRLTQRIARMNTEIAALEGGGLIGSDASGLRDQRYADLEELASLVDLDIQEQFNGSIHVFVGGDYLVSNGLQRDVYAASNNSEGSYEIRIVETDSLLEAKGGEAGAISDAVSTVFGEYLEGLDEFAANLIRTFNDVHSQGQGGKGFSETTSVSPGVAGVPLKNAGYAFDVSNGSFDFSLIDESGELLSSNRIGVRVTGGVGDSTIDSIAAEIDAIDGVTAALTNEGQIEITSDSPLIQFAFGEDTSGFLSVAGLNTFFTGSNASDIGIRQQLTEDSGFLAISKGGVGQDTETLINLVDLVDRPLDDGSSVRQMYEQLTAGLGQQIGIQRSASDGLDSFYQTLRAQHLGVTGVNIDEEAIKLITYQRAFQASSKVISTAAEMLELLVSL